MGTAFQCCKKEDLPFICVLFCCLFVHPFKFLDIFKNNINSTLRHGTRLNAFNSKDFCNNLRRWNIFFPGRTIILALKIEFFCALPTLSHNLSPMVMVEVPFLLLVGLSEARKTLVLTPIIKCLNHLYEVMTMDHLAQAHLSTIEPQKLVLRIQRQRHTSVQDVTRGNCVHAAYGASWWAYLCTRHCVLTSLAPPYGIDVRHGGVIFSPEIWEPAYTRCCPAHFGVMT